MITQFAAAAEAVGTSITFHDNEEEAVAYFAQLANGAPASFSPLPASVQELVDTRSFTAPESADKADVTLSYALCGIAATGSLLLNISDRTGRAATALTTRHAVILHRSNVVGELSDALPIIGGQLAADGGAYLTLTTGPSRTADIERVLTIGVHGPKELHILLVGKE